MSEVFGPLLSPGATLSPGIRRVARHGVPGILVILLLLLSVLRPAGPSGFARDLTPLFRRQFEDPGFCAQPPKINSMRIFLFFVRHERTQTISPPRPKDQQNT